MDKHCDQTLIHTGQNYDPGLSDIFFQELGLRSPDIHLGVRAKSFANQIGQMIPALDEAIERANPDRVMVLGDTNSTLAAAIVTARRRIPTFHLEAGNRCYDDRVPEEVNRRIIDHCCTVHMPYTHRSKENLVKEGIARERIFVIGNPIKEAMQAFDEQSARSSILSQMALSPGQYFLVTAHRTENVDDRDRLASLCQGLAAAGERYQLPVIVSTHPRTADKLKQWGIRVDERWVRLHEPFGFFDFMALERSARCLITDSGTVQEEGCILGIPAVTIRDTTERPETIECGSNILAGVNPDSLLRALGIVLEGARRWNPPSEYLEDSVSRTVAQVVLGYMA